MKTPILKLIEDLTRRGIFLNPSKIVLMIKRHIDYWRLQEEDFAKECFKAGRDYERNKEVDFDSFYSQFKDS